MRFFRGVLEVVRDRAWLVPVAVPSVILVSTSQAWAQGGTGGAAEEGGGGWMFAIFWLMAFAGSIAALVYAWRFFRSMMAADEGNEAMIEIAGHVRTGANAYLWQQYKIVFLFFVVICGLLAAAAFYLGAQSRWVPFAFLTGGFF